MIQPPGTSYTISATHDWVNSPLEPVVVITERELDGSWIRRHVVAPWQAQYLAGRLLHAAEWAERNFETVKPNRATQ